MDRKVETLRAHPAADAYRLMTDDELAELAESIRANGLRDPITVGAIGNERWIVDGRNREKACAAAGVPPKYEEIKFADETALRAFVLDRSERRNITSSQKAMALAMVFPEAARLKRKADVQRLNFSKALLSNARAVLAYSPELAQAVRDGTMALGRRDETSERSAPGAVVAETMRAALQAEAPDLLEAVDEGRMKLTEAKAELEARRQEIEKHKRTVTGNLASIVRALYPMGAPPERVDAQMFNDVDPLYWPPHLPPLTNETVQACVDVLSSFVKRWPEKGEIK